MPESDPYLRLRRITFAACGVGGLAVAGWLVWRSRPLLALGFLLLVLPTMALVVEAGVRRFASREAG
jgi:hypothetical protein